MLPSLNPFDLVVLVGSIACIRYWTGISKLLPLYSLQYFGIQDCQRPHSMRRWGGLVCRCWIQLIGSKGRTKVWDILVEEVYWDGMLQAMPTIDMYMIIFINKYKETKWSNFHYLILLSLWLDIYNYSLNFPDIYNGNIPKDILHCWNTRLPKAAPNA